MVRSSTAHEALESLLAQASGHLEIEFDAVRRLFRSGKSVIDRDLVRRVRGLFAPIQGRPHLDQALADLDLLVSQPPPPQPDPDPTKPWNAKFFRDLARYIRVQGYFVESLAYYLSMLPSCTEISKKCLFAGQPEPFKGTAYGRVVEKVWEQALGGRRVRYLAHIGALRAIKRREHDVYFLNYLLLDIALHQDEEQIAQPRVNLVELAPKGTGKSFVYDNLSRYARVIGGGKITPAVLFHNLASHTPGLITRYDVIVLDEVQSIRGDSAGELIAGLKVYLEAGRYSRGNTMGTAEASFVMEELGVQGRFFLRSLARDASHGPV